MLFGTTLNRSMFPLLSIVRAVDPRVVMASIGRGFNGAASTGTI